MEFTTVSQQLDRHMDLYKEIKRCLYHASSDLYQNDGMLLTRSFPGDEDHLCDRCIAFRYGLYLHSYISKNKYLSKYDLDCEYNRDMYNPKELPGYLNGCYPDLILHKRLSNKDNLLVIECKGWWSSQASIKEDKAKLTAFVESEKYQYHFGLLLTFGKDAPQYEWISRHQDITFR